MLADPSILFFSTARVFSLELLFMDFDFSVSAIVVLSCGSLFHSFICLMLFLWSDFISMSCDCYLVLPVLFYICVVVVDCEIMGDVMRSYKMLVCVLALITKSVCSVLCVK